MSPIESQSHSPERGSTSRILRRTFVGATIAALCGGVIEEARRAGLWRGADIGVGTLAALERQLQMERAAFAAQYLEHPEGNVDTEAATRLFLETELARSLREHPDCPEVKFDDFLSQTYRPFMDGVKWWVGVPEERSSDRMAHAESLSRQCRTPSIAMIARVKLGLHDQLGEDACYYAKSNNVIDALSSKEIQCRSGSRLLLLALLENVDGKLQPGERLVTIHSNQHQQVGLLMADGKLIAFEMTKTGTGIQELGALDAIQTPIIVTDAKHDLAQAGLNRRAHPSKTVLRDTVPAEFDRLESIYDKRGLVGGGQICSPKFKVGIGGEITATTDQYGFGDGTVRIPEGRIPLAPMDRVPSRFSTNRSPDGSGSSIYDTINTSSRETYGDLLDLMTPDERTAVIAYEQHSPNYSRYMNAIDRSYRRILYDRDADIGAEVENLRQQCDALVQYMQETGLNRQYQAYEAALRSFHRRTGKGVSYPRNPAEYAESVLKHLLRLSQEGRGRGRPDQ
jgi:hypothetical protein